MSEYGPNRSNDKNSQRQNGLLTQEGKAAATVSLESGKENGYTSGMKYLMAPLEGGEVSDFNKNMDSIRRNINLNMTMGHPYKNSNSNKNESRPDSIYETAETYPHQTVDPEAVTILMPKSNRKDSAPDTTKDILSIEKLEKYDLYELLGKGGYGVVRRGVDSENPTHSVAVKIVPHNREEEFKFGIPASFIQELSAQQGLKHKNLVPILDIVVNSQFYGIVMPIAKMSLQAYLDESSPEDGSYYYKYNTRERLRIASDIIHGLMYLHKQGWLHMDLKPHNVLLFEEKKGFLSAKISDFGLAIPNTTPTDITFSNGTVVFFAPEIFNVAIFGSVGREFDYWALGIILLHLILDINFMKQVLDASVDRNYRESYAIFLMALFRGETSNLAIGDIINDYLDYNHGKMGTFSLVSLRRKKMGMHYSDTSLFFLGRIMNKGFADFFGDLGHHDDDLRAYIGDGIISLLSLSADHRRSTYMDRLLDGVEGLSGSSSSSSSSSSIFASSSSSSSSSAAAAATTITRNPSLSESNSNSPHDAADESFFIKWVEFALNGRPTHFDSVIYDATKYAGQWSVGFKNTLKNVQLLACIFFSLKKHTDVQAAYKLLNSLPSDVARTKLLAREKELVTFLGWKI